MVVVTGRHDTSGKCVYPSNAVYAASRRDAAKQTRKLHAAAAASLFPYAKAWLRAK